ncbi:MAG: hypothetical protein ABSA96_15155 [Candidatus Acidiferrales bacterium]|jgi:hypothetical protein
MTLRHLSDYERKYVSAIHEAGHVVVAEHFGLNIILATISKDVTAKLGRPQNSGLVLTEAPKDFPLIHECARKSGGFISEQLLFPGLISDGAKHDHEELGYVSEGMRRIARKNAEKILTNRKHHLEKMVEYLLQHKAIASYDDDSYHPVTDEEIATIALFVKDNKERVRPFAAIDPQFLFAED